MKGGVLRNLEVIFFNKGGGVYLLRKKQGLFVNIEYLVLLGRFEIENI